MPRQPSTRVPARVVKIGIAGLAGAGLALGPAAVIHSQAALATPAAGSQLQAGHPAPLPAELAPPAGSVPAGRYPARGVQVYTCTAGSWTFTEPAATLTAGPGGPGVAVHFRGPSWQSTTDGSLVVAKAVASVKVEGSVPQLLLQATSTRGPGRFGSISYIQRLHTSGGAAPTGACTEGATVGVGYRAEYVFYRAG